MKKPFNSFYFKTYDVFLSYVIEDRDIAEQVIGVLQKRGLRVWYAHYELYPGVDPDVFIRKGMRASRYGLALISRHYTSHWARGELFMLTENRKHFIPVLCGIDYEQLTA